jgi:hypothetical protein
MFREPKLNSISPLNHSAKEAKNRPNNASVIRRRGLILENFARVKLCNIDVFLIEVATSRIKPNVKYSENVRMLVVVISPFMSKIQFNGNKAIEAIIRE